MLQVGMLKSTAFSQSYRVLRCWIPALSPLGGAILSLALVFAGLTVATRFVPGERRRAGLQGGPSRSGNSAL